MADKDSYYENYDDQTRLHTMNPEYLQYWNTLDIAELYNYRDKITERMNRLSYEMNQEMIKEMKGILQDLEDYIQIRQKREGKDNNTDIIL